MASSTCVIGNESVPTTRKAYLAQEMFIRGFTMCTAVGCCRACNIITSAYLDLQLHKLLICMQHRYIYIYSQPSS